MPQMMRKPNPTDIQPPRNITPSRRRGDASVERSLTKVREAHQKALAMVATLEEEIEWLSCPIIRSCLEARAHSQSRDHCRCRSRGQKRKHHQVWLEDCHAPYFMYYPSQRSSESEGDAAATEDLNLEEPPELGLDVTCFLQGSAKRSEEENMKLPSPKPPIEELQKWVNWKAGKCKTPSWWQDLTMVPGVDKYEKLACEVWASFQLLKRASEGCCVKNDHQAHWHHHVFAGRISCCCQILSLPARISRRSSVRRWWCMPGPFSSGQRRLICLLEINHAFWWGV